MIKKLAYKGIEVSAIVKDGKEHLQKCWVVGRFYEAQGGGLLNELFRREKEGGKFVDIGASIGNHTLFFAGVMKGKVIAFEPQKDSYLHLQENLALNGLRVDAYNVALGEKEGMVTMVSKAPNNVGMYEVKEGGGETILHTLDMYKDVVAGYDVIKIDVENYNRQLLRGAKKVLTGGNGNVYIEAENYEVLKETDAIMLEYGYKRVEGLVMNHTATYLYYKPF